MLDKTGTITIGNRKATHFNPSHGIDTIAFTNACVYASLADETPEGRSIIELAETGGYKRPAITGEPRYIGFTAETRSSGVDLPNGKKIRKGAFDTIRLMVTKEGNIFSGGNGRPGESDLGKWRYTPGCE